MRFPDIHESAAYGNPEDYLERKQAREANAKRRAEAAGKPVLHCKPGWSAARQRAEALFDFAPEPVLASTPGTHRNDGRPNGEDSA